MSEANKLETAEQDSEKGSSLLEKSSCVNNKYVEQYVKTSKQSNGEPMDKNQEQPEDRIVVVAKEEEAATTSLSGASDRDLSGAGGADQRSMPAEGSDRRHRRCEALADISLKSAHKLALTDTDETGKEPDSAQVDCANPNNAGQNGDVMIVGKLEPEQETSKSDGGSSGGDDDGEARGSTIDFAMKPARKNSSERESIDELEPEGFVSEQVMEVGDIELDQEQKQKSDQQIEQQQQLQRQTDNLNYNCNNHHHYHHNRQRPEEGMLLEESSGETIGSSFDSEDKRKKDNDISIQITGRKFSDNCSICHYLASVRATADSKAAAIIAKQSPVGQADGRESPEMGATDSAAAAPFAELKRENSNGNSDTKVQQQEITPAKINIGPATPTRRWGLLDRAPPIWGRQSEELSRDRGELPVGRFESDRIQDKYKFVCQADQVIKRLADGENPGEAGAGLAGESEENLHLNRRVGDKSVAFAYAPSSPSIDSKLKQRQIEYQRAVEAKGEDRNSTMSGEQSGKEDCATVLSSTNFVRSLEKRSMKILRGLSLDGNKQISSSIRRVNSKLLSTQKRKSQSTKLIVINSENASYTIQGK